MTSLIVYPSYPKRVLEIISWLFSEVINKYHRSRNEIKFELIQIRKAQNDPHEFAPIYNKYYDDIFIYVSKRIGDYDAVADVTSKIFTNCLSKIEKFKYMGVPFSAWLYKIAINEIRQFFRAQKRFPRTICITDSDFQDISQEAIEPSKYDKAQEIVPKLLATLSETELQCIELRFFEKKSFKEIGYLMGLTEVNAKVRTYRILKKLKEKSLLN